MTIFHNDVLANYVKAHITSMAQSYAYTKFGRIKEYDPKTCFVKVAYYNPDTDDWDLLSNWLFYMTAVQGRGDDSEAKTGDVWGNVHGPNINEQVVVIPPDGDHNNGIVIGSCYTDPRPPPQLNGEFTASGEWLYMHKTGSYIKYTNDGDLFIKAKRNLRVIVDGKADITVLGDTNLTVGGNVAANVDGSLSATVGGSVTANVDGSLTANVGGSMTASIVGSSNIQSLGPNQIQSETDISILSRGVVRIQGDLGVLIESPIIVETLAPISPETAVQEITVPPLPPLNISAPAQPIKAVDTDTGPQESVLPDAPQQPVVSNVTDTSADVTFTDPNA
jgi:phage baseplate assembly protein gpV